MHYRYQSRDTIYEINLERHGSGYRAVIAGQSYDLEVIDSQPGELTLRLDGRPLTIYWASDGGAKWFSTGGCTYHLEKPSPSTRRSSEHSEDSLRAPMPAQVLSVDVAAGDAVEKGDTLLRLEAMKMEIRLKAPRPATIKRVLASVGEQVERDQVLVELEG
jgi:acetyl/propionyl-CoA carboxylase alpha subunit